MIKRHLSKRTTLVQLVGTLLGHVASREDERASEAVLRARERVRLVEGDSVLLANLAGKLTRYAFDIVEVAYRESKSYAYKQDTRTVRRLDDDGTSWSVSDEGGCSCKASTFMGLPCPHLFTYARVQQVRELPPAVVLPRWHEDAPQREMARPALDLDAWWDMDTGASEPEMEEEDEAEALLDYIRAHRDRLIRSGKLGELRKAAHAAVQEADALDARHPDALPAVVIPESIPAPRVPLPTTITQDTVLPAGAVIGDPCAQQIKKKGRKSKADLVRAAKRLKSALEIRGLSRSGKKSKASKSSSAR
jgi:hypothetical protein